MTFLYVTFLWFLLPLAVYLWRRRVKQSFQQNLRWLALALLVTAVARPVIPQAMHEEKLPAHALIVALDLSASMQATDIEPSRAKASRSVIKSFLELNIYDQISLIGFTINPLLLSPSTTDHRLVQVALESLRSDYLLTKGTDLSKLLEKVARFPDQEKRVILFSDGGDEPISEALLTFSKEHKIELLMVVMATEQGATIPTSKGLLKDKAGHIVVSKWNASLEKLGRVIPYSGEKETAEAIQEWVEEQKLIDEGIVRKTQAHSELFFIPALLALILLFLSATRFSFKLLALLALLNINVQAEELLTKEGWGVEKKFERKSQEGGFFDGYHLKNAYAYYAEGDYNSTLEELEKIGEKSLESEVALAHTYYKLERYKASKATLLTIRTRKPKVKQQLLYELGNCEAKLAYYEKAKNYYVKALQFGEDEDILHNLAWVLVQEEADKSTVGYSNPSSPQASQGSEDDEESEEEHGASKEEQGGGASGGSSSKKSKNATVKVVKSHEKSKHKRVMSSKAYDLINEGYIREKKPW